MTPHLKSYPSYKDSAVEWLGDVPVHWQVRRMRTVARILNGATPSSNTPAYWDGDILWITPEDLGALNTRYIENTARRITHDGYYSCGTTLAPVGSLAISTRAPIGHIGILGFPACANQGCKLIVPDNSLKSAYFYHIFQAGQSELKSYGQGTTFAELSRGKLAEFHLPAPPLPEQTAIARYLDHATRRIRRYIRAKRKQIALLEEQKQAIIHQAVTGRIDVRTGRPYSAYKPSGVEWLGDMPKKWKAVPLQRITLDRCDGPFGSGLKSSHYTDEGIRVVRLQNIGHGEFNDSDAAFISPEHYTTLGDHSVGAGDVLIAGLGDPNHPAGRACVAPENIVPAMVKADCFRFRLNPDLVNPEFIALQLTATATEASAILSTGATRQRTNLRSTSARLVGIPSVHEQERIIEYARARTSRIGAVEQATKQEISLLREYRTRLIADVVTGKLDVREAAAALPEVDPLEAEDEPEGVIDSGSEETVDELDAVLEEAGA